MRIMSWNCNMALRDKWRRVQDYKADILVLQECENPSILYAHVTADYNCFWTGQNKNKGLCVLIDKQLDAELLPVDPGDVRFMLPLRVGNRLNVIAFWAMNDRQHARQRYIAQVWTGLQKCKNHLSDPTVVAGDFNWNAKWDDSTRTALHGNMRDVVEMLDNFGIRSAYHTLRSVKYGMESDPTLFMYRQRERPYHIDYVFLSEKLMECAKTLSLGGFDEWKSMSDHMPIFLELELP